MEKKLNNGGIKKLLKSRKFRIICVFTGLFLILLFAIWFTGLFRTPAHFRTVNFIEDHQVSQYLTNIILPEFYNKSQLGTPFEIVFSEEGINDIVARHLDAKSLKRAGFSDVSITFKSGRILLTAKTKYRNHDFVITAVLKPTVDKKGFNAGLSEIQAGTSSIPFAKDLIRERVLYEIAGSSADVNFVSYAGMVFSDDKIEPEFSFNHRNLKIEKITIDNQKLIVSFLPD
ncbi:MAG: hypothetical protein A2Y10_14315 [Planctomycetes bacterium GWF2_41_51]|nr:MAG: hypothetical protein A2Y10_14315 [Planctomycetes bacterium GWF2_41_51]HBG28740.1 hypothetical protein [Phycisphaerales bacterium]